MGLKPLTGYDEDFLLGEGRSLLKNYPKKNGPIFPTETAGTVRGPRKPDKSNPTLVDLFSSLEGPLVASKKLADLVAKSSASVELLPVGLARHKEPYFILNVLAQLTCAGLQPDMLESDKRAQVQAKVKPSAIPAREAMVHVAESHVYLVRDDLAEVLVGAGCTGMTLTPLGRS